MIYCGVPANQWASSGIAIAIRKVLSAILYADDQILMATSEDDLQTMAHHLNLIARKYKMTISSTKQNQ